MDRRKFLRGIGFGLLALSGCSRAGKATAAGEGTAETSRGRHATAPPKSQAPGTATVVLVTCEDWKSSPDAPSLRRGLAAGIEALTGLSSADAWRRFFRPDENIAVKVNCIAGAPLSSSPALTRALVEELTGAGHPAARIWVYDRTSAELEEAGYELSREEHGVKCLGTDEIGYDDEVTPIGDTGTWFSLIVSQWADAIINVPIGKDHDLCGISGALKNHFGSISNPNKLHYPELSAAIADVAAAPPIAGKQRLVVYDLLRVCYDGGPAYKPATTKPYGAVLLATDPVAADTIVAGILDQVRSAAGLKSLWDREAKPLHLSIAADEAHSLGHADRSKIHLERVRL